MPNASITARSDDPDAFLCRKPKIGRKVLLFAENFVILILGMECVISADRLPEKRGRCSGLHRCQE